MTIKWPFWFDDVLIVIVVVLILLGYRSSCTALFLFYIWEYLMFYWFLEIFCSEYASVSNSFLMSIFAFYSVGIRIIYVKSLHIHRNIISRLSLCCWIMLNICMTLQWWEEFSFLALLLTKNFYFDEKHFSNNLFLSVTKLQSPCSTFKNLV